MKNACCCIRYLSGYTDAVRLSGNAKCSTYLKMACALEGSCSCKSSRCSSPRRPQPLRSVVGSVPWKPRVLQCGPYLGQQDTTYLSMTLCAMCMPSLVNMVSTRPKTKDQYVSQDSLMCTRFLMAGSTVGVYNQAISAANDMIQRSAVCSRPANRTWAPNKTEVN